MPANVQFCLRCGRPLQASLEPGVSVGAKEVGRKSAPGPTGRRSLAQMLRTWPGRALAVVLVVVMVAVASTGLYLNVHAPARSMPTPLTGQGTTPTSMLISTPALAPTSTIASPATPDQLALTFNRPAFADVSGLHIQTDGVFCGRYLVLAQPQYTYDDATIAQMREYLSSLALRNFMWRQPLDLLGLPPLPAVLQLAVGAGVANASGGLEEGCAGALTITNTGAAPIQITQFGVIYANDSVENTYSYRLIDACTFLNLLDCAGQGSSTCTVASSMTLSAGSAGKMVTTPVNACGLDVGDPPIPTPLTLAPAQTTVLKIGFNSAAISYRVHLTLGISTAAAGAALLTLPASFDSTLVFTSAQSNMVCYSLQDHTFTPLPSSTPAYKQLCV